LSGVLQLPDAILKLPFFGFQSFNFLMMSDWDFHKREAGDWRQDFQGLKFELTVAVRLESNVEAIHEAVSLVRKTSFAPRR
jgi:hypothetical protein